MTDEPRSFASQLDALATEFFGEFWAAPVAHFTGANQRNLQRIRSAVRRGDEDLYALHVLNRLRTRTGELEDRLAAIPLRD